MNYLPEGSLTDTQENRRCLSSLAELKRTCESGRIVEACVKLCDRDKNLIVDLSPFSHESLRAVIPKEECAVGIAEGSVRDVAIISRVGKTVCFKVQNADSPSSIMLSRRAAQLDAMEHLKKNLNAGDVIKARVTHCESFGAFVDIGCGIVSFIGIENISVSRIRHPSERFSPGDDILALVSDVSRESFRVSLTHKQLLGTWEENAALFAAGETVEGIVRSCESYGAFIELTPNLSGLSEPAVGVAEGQRVCVYIKSIIPERMKIKLSVVSLLENRRNSGKISYFITEGPVRYWRYTPEYAKKPIIETFFE